MQLRVAGVKHTMSLSPSPRIPEVLRENLIKQFIYFDEELSYLLERTSPAIAERNEINTTTERYRSHVGHILSDFEQADPGSWVLIGCTVTIQYEEDGLEEAFTIVLPDYSNVDEGFISFISPLGRRLLLSRIGDRVEIVSPLNTYTVLVKDIGYRK